jgi:hypothetical protein
MRKLSLTLLLLLAFSVLSIGGLKAVGGTTPVWPAVENQLARDHVQPGTALEKLIRANQDFSLLRPEEANDKLLIPLWLRVNWRKAHPEGNYSSDDATGGYPLVLREVAEWMVHHQNLQTPPEALDVTGRAATAGANLRISGAQTTPRSESAITINVDNPNQILAASNAIAAGGRQAIFFSSNGGATWGQTSLGPLQQKDAFHSDPTADWTQDGNAWSLTIGINNAGSILKMRSYKSTTGGSTWAFDATFSGTQSATDKEMLWVDHSATSPFRNNLYACWHNNNPGFVNRRTSTGWGAPLQVTGAESTGTAIGCDIRTNSAGDVFTFWPTTGNSKIVVAKSTNGGASYGAGKVIATTFDNFDIGVPSFASRRAFIYVAGGAYKNGTTNNVYASWLDLTGATGCTSPANEPGTNAASTCKTRIWFARSTDGGTTWGAPFMINNQASLNDQFNQWLSVDPSNGKIGIMYYDTVGDATRKKTNVFYQSSSDGGVTWSAPLKVSTAATDETIAGADSGNQYGDYNGLSGYLGKFFPSWTDRRNNAKEEIWTAPITDP